MQTGVRFVSSPQPEQTNEPKANESAAYPGSSRTVINYDPAALIAIGAGIAAIIGSFGTWAKGSIFILTVSTSGTDVDGKYTAALAGVGVALILWSMYTKPTSSKTLGAVVAFGAAAFFAGRFWMNANEVINSAELEAGTISVGWGVMVTTVGGAIAALASFALFDKAQSLYKPKKK